MTVITFLKFHANSNHRSNGTLPRRRDFLVGTNKERPMTSKTIALVMAFVLSSTMALAQSSQGKAGSDNGPTSNAPTTSGNMNQDTTVGAAKKSKTTKCKRAQPEAPKTPCGARLR
jgi:hypothetical protein